MSAVRPMMRKIFYLSFYLLIAASATAGAGAQYVGPPATASARSPLVASADELDALLKADAPSKILHVGDTFRVQVYGVRDYEVERRVEADGTVSIPLLGSVPARGLVPEALERQIAAMLSERELIVDPQVTITVLTEPSQTVVVGGDVAKPGLFPAPLPHTLDDYLAQAGGLLPTASALIVLHRPGRAEDVAIPLGPDAGHSQYSNIPIFAGDEIRVGRVGGFYVVGALRSQGFFPLKTDRPTTVLDAIALAGGIGFEASRPNAIIVRTEDGRRVQMSLDINKIFNRTASDPTLLPDDILYVPTNAMKAALKSGGASLAVSLAAAFALKQ